MELEIKLSTCCSYKGHELTPSTSTPMVVHNYSQRQLQGIWCPLLTFTSTRHARGARTYKQAKHQYKINELKKIKRTKLKQKNVRINRLWKILQMCWIWGGNIRLNNPDWPVYFTTFQVAERKVFIYIWIVYRREIDVGCISACVAFIGWW